MNAVGGLFEFDVVAGDAGSLGRDGAIVDEGWAREHGLGVGDAFSITSARGDRLSLRVRALEDSPRVLDVLTLGPMTISRETFDGAFAADRNRFTFVTGGLPVCAPPWPGPKRGGLVPRRTSSRSRPSGSGRFSPSCGSCSRWP